MFVAIVRLVLRVRFWLLFSQSSPSVTGFLPDLSQRSCALALGPVNGCSDRRRKLLIVFGLVSVEPGVGGDWREPDISLAACVVS